LFLIQDEPGRSDPACWDLIVNMQAGERMSLEQIRAFLEASDEVEFRSRNRVEVYGWVNQLLRQLHFQELKRSGRGLVRRYVAKMTGMSRAQVTRLLAMYLCGEEVKPKPYRRHRFRLRYTREDVGLLAEVDEAHETLSGPATQKILQREYHDFGDPKYQRLARLSVSQLYRLRHGSVYRQRRVAFQPTRPTKVAIGERRRPEPNGRPGYLRVDTVHQGDLDGTKGVYHINAVDEVTQWQVVGAVAQISEAYLLPVLQAMLAQFPFRIRGFHSDNGSEFINHRVAELLNKLLIEQTKSRPRHSNDNGLAETKNGAVVRKHMGYTHIAAPHAAEIDAFYVKYFNPYLNFHRPCGVPEEVVNPKGKVKRVYRWYATPWEILRQLPGLAGHLKSDVTIQELERQARAKTDTAAAIEMQKAKQKLFASFPQKRSA
jgi:transposase InsO family protein